ncbi:MAG: hypothetical protein A3G25_04830 [Betaproteobacteria bacterium RIFCSPLOWO2_12_FULL_63_13]|nr:MAG: hypothetical protein A3G25_04830 [Betaproteobacteria bacterium RIFCSPLOWO2_12_FULL_63_13]
MTNFDQPHFQDDDKAREYLEAIRWPNGPVCPHCGVIGGHYQLQGKAHRVGVWKCKDCREQFTVTVGTVFERSHIPLHTWMQAVFLLCSSKKGMSSKQLERTLDVTYKTAWFMSHRLREAIKPNGGGLLGGNGGTVEADETYIMKKHNRRTKDEFTSKNAVFSLVERNGAARSFHVPDVTGKTLKTKLFQYASPTARIMTDEATQYKRIKGHFAGHETVNHSAFEYSRGNAHTNTVEGFFSIFKRGIYGVYQHVSTQHLGRYSTEFDFRYTYRERKVNVNGRWQKLGFDDVERMNVALTGISGKRLTYRRTNA